jgi:hypothetical protein
MRVNAEALKGDPTGTAEREEAKALIDRRSPGSTRRLTVAADKGYDTTSSPICGRCA